MPPETRYARSGDLSIAYQALGDRPFDVVFVPPTVSHFELGIDVRSGLHTGACELVDGKISGIALHTGARVAAHAGPGEVLVSSTVKDLIAGSGLDFEDRGLHELKGIPGEWRLYAAL